MKNTIDLNSYRFIDLLCQYKSQAKVCHSLAISKATFNRQLAECRNVFDNELFIASKGSYEPTFFTSQLQELIQTPLEQLAQVPQLSQALKLEHRNLEYVFAIINPLSSQLTVPLLKTLTRSEHQPKISFIDWSLESIEFPQRNTFALAIGGYPNDLNDRMVERKIAALPLYIYASDRAGLGEPAKIELQAIANAETVRVSMGALDDASYYARIRKLSGVILSQKLTVACVNTALACVQCSPYLLVNLFVPDALLPDGVRRIPLYHAGQALTFNVGMQYHRALYQHPVVQRIEQCIRNALTHNG